MFHCETDGAVVTTPDLLVQYRSKSTAIAGGNVWSNGGSVTTYASPDPVLAGNTVVFFMRVTGNIASPSSFAVSDDKSGTWTAGPNTFEATGNVSCFSWYSSGITAGMRRVQVQNNTGSDLTGHQMMCAQFYNVGALDVSTSHTGSSGTLASGAINPTQANDLIVMAAFRTSSPTTTSFTAGSQANITQKLLGENLFNGHCMQWGVYTTTGSWTPQLASGTSGPYATLTLAFKSAVAGSARPAGEQIVGLTSVDFRPGDFSSTQVLQISPVGNLRVLMMLAGVAPNAPAMTGVAESGTATWVSCGTGATNNSRTSCWCGQNGAAKASMTITQTLDKSSGDYTVHIYDIIGAPASALDTNVSTTGNDFASGDLNTGLSLTPAAAGLIFGIAGQGTNTMNGLTTPASGFFDNDVFDGELQDGPSTPDENNGMMHYYNPNTTAVGLVFQEKFVTGKGPWAAQMCSFKGA